MLWFDGLIFDKDIEGTDSVVTAPELNDKLGEPGGFELTVYADNIGGTTNLTVTFEVSPDGLNWYDQTPPLVNLVGVALTGNTLLHSAVPNSTKFTRLRVVLTGTQPQARIRMWAAGRTVTVAGVNLGQRLFHELVFDQAMTTPTSTASTEGHETLLACADQIYFFVVADAVSAGPLALTVQIYESPEGETWSPKQMNPELTMMVNAFQVNKDFIGDPGLVPSSGFVRLVANLFTDGSANAHVRIWVTGRAG